MKTFIIENNLYCAQEGKPVWSFLPDSALCNAGKPFFIPENADSITAFISPAIKITRLGKSIAPRFSKRYYSEAAPAIHFRDMGYREYLTRHGLPTDMSQAFDRALIIGEFENAVTILGETPLSMYKNNEKVDEWKKDDLTTTIDELFPAISAFNTLKMGDYLIPALSIGTEVKIGDNLELKLGDRTILNVMIK